MSSFFSSSLGSSLSLCVAFFSLPFTVKLFFLFILTDITYVSRQLVNTHIYAYIDLLARQNSTFAPIISPNCFVCYIGNVFFFFIFTVITVEMAIGMRQPTCAHRQLFEYLH